ncbi:hypothetical protein MAR_010320 [Mya arenaria]|uniref:Uncharacterized protein n=1 Tax=Mya arenaria TaxID=6604 RepID=A0ABY7E4N5_MYAAR|nr:hypothetical protein MAR_010320 [Mya arenaria]
MCTGIKLRNMSGIPRRPFLRGPILGADCDPVLNGTDQCADPNAACGVLSEQKEFCNNVCWCTDGFVIDIQDNCGGTCVPQKTYSEVCDPSIRDICAPVDTLECSVNGTEFVCDCLTGFVYNGTECVRPDLYYNDTCTCEDICLPPETVVCNSTTGKCDCREGFIYNATSGQCERPPGDGIDLGDPCLAAVSCGQYPNVKCEFPDTQGTGKKNKVCQCDDDKDFCEVDGVCVLSASPCP